MFEFFFTLTVAFLAYVVKDAYTAITRANKGEPILPPRPAKASPAVTAPAPTPASPVVTEKPKVAPTPPAASVTPANNLRNPATGEITAVPANYRFAKKWIKDALVSEKLLDRVYKPSQLDDATAKKAKDAIEQLRTIAKYQG
ncbi:MAG: hypothetical protein ACK443_06465 [Methylococcaceae bacterium]